MRGRLGLLGPDVDAGPHRRPVDVPRRRGRARELRAFVDRAFEIWSGEAATRPPGRAGHRPAPATMTEPLEIRSMLRNEIAERRARGRAADRRASTTSSTRCAACGGPRSSAAPGPARRCSPRRRRGGSPREGFRTLLVCFNSPLARDARRRGRGERGADRAARRQDVPPAVRGPRARGGRAAGERPDARAAGVVGRDTLPRALDDAIEQLGPRYHAIVVDEGQDFDAGWLLSLEALLFDGTRGRPVRLPRPRAGDLPRGRRRGSSGCRSIPLDMNCRNAQPIHDVVRAVRRGGGLGRWRCGRTAARPS